MSLRDVPVKAVAAGAGIMLVLALSFPLLSGSTSYVVPRGASMKPGVSAGDLAIVRAASSYRVGDVAAYRNTALHRVVVHRIVAVEGDTYTFKGDANSFNDPEVVRRSQIVGTLAFSVPLLGSVLLWLTSPVNALLLLALIVLAVRDRNRRKERPYVAAEAAVPPHEVEPLPLEDERIIPITDMSFPHELAVAEVMWPESLLQLAERYDRPVLHDKTAGALFVVESSMLFRCLLEAPAVAPVPLSIVREAVAEPTPVFDVLPSESPRTVAPEPPTERERRHNWPRRRSYGGRRKPSPHGRDWAYAAGK